MKTNIGQVAKAVKADGDLTRLVSRLENMLGQTRAMAEEAGNAVNRLLGSIPESAEKNIDGPPASSFATRADNLLYAIEQAVSDTRDAVRRVEDALN